MPEKDPTNWTTATWVLAMGMAFGGGFINWYSKVKAGHTRIFNVAELFGEMLISGVVGLASYMAGDGFGLPASLCAVAAGIGGHRQDQRVPDRHPVIRAQIKRAQHRRPA